MIKLNRVVALALGLILTLSVMPTLARAELGKGYPGETAKVQIVVEDVISLDGEVSISAGSEFVESIDCAVVERGGLKGGMVTGNKVFLYSTAANPTPGDVTIEVTVNLKENAEVNEQCIVSLNYVGSTDAAGMTPVPVHYQTMSYGIYESSDCLLGQHTSRSKKRLECILNDILYIS